MKSTKRLPNKFKVLLVKFYNRQQLCVNSIVMKISYIQNNNKMRNRKKQFSFIGGKDCFIE